MIKYVKYSLLWEGPIGNQPYQKVASYGATFSGGVIVNNLTELISHDCKDRVYFGYISGSTSQILLDAIAGCSEYKMEELTLSNAQSFFDELIPINSQVRINLNGITVIKYRGNLLINGDGTISFQLKDTPS